MFPIKNYIQAIEELCRELRVKRLDLVGSASREDFEPQRSDMDFLVEFDGLDRLFYRYFTLKAELEKKLGRSVDIIQKNALKNPYVKETLERDKVRIYGT